MKRIAPTTRPTYTAAEKDAWFRRLKASGLKTNVFCRLYKAEGCPCPATFTHMREREAVGEVEEPRPCSRLSDQEVVNVVFMFDAHKKGKLSTKKKVARMACLGSFREINAFADNKLLQPMSLYRKRPLVH